jgi:hypothetical protein
MPKKNYPKPKDSEQTEEFSTEPLIGIVSDCLRLNIRKEPRADAPILCVTNALSEVMITTNKSTDNWYSVCTESGIEGFCMKKYIAIRR